MAKTLQYTISGDSRDFQRAMAGVSKSVEGVQGHVGKLNRIGGTMGRGIAAGARVGAAGFAALGFGAFKSVQAFEESNKIAKQTAATLKSTGGAANITAKEVANLATQISNKTGIDDEQIQSGENLLLTFTKVRNEVGKGNDIFNQATKVATDMSVALGQDTKSSVMQLGKALNDPIKGVSALSRVGVSFTEQQKEQIKALVGSGDAMKAQKIILGELTKEFGGSAAAAATPFDKLKVTLGNLEETIGGALAPVFEKAATFLNTFVRQMMSGEGAGGGFADIMRRVGDVLASVAQTLVSAWPAIKSVAVAVFGAVGDAVTKVRNTITSFVSRNRSDIEAFLNAIKNVGKVIKSVFLDVVLPVVAKMLPGIKSAFEGVLRIVKGAVELISGILTGDFGKAWQGVKNIFSGALKDVVGLVSAATAPIRAGAKAIADTLERVIGGGWDAVKSVAQTAIQFMRDRLADVLGFFQKILEAASHIPVIGGKFKAAAKGIQDMRDGLYGVKDGFDAANTSAGGLLGTLQHLIEKQAELADGPPPGHTGTKRAELSVGSSPGGSADDWPAWAGNLHTGGAAGGGSRSVFGASGGDPANKLGALIGGTVRDPHPPTRLDYLTSSQALAGLTVGTGDDKTAAKAAVKYWRQQLKKAKKGKDPRKIAAAAQALASAKAALGDLTPEPEVADPPTPVDYLSASSAVAGTTADPADDIAAAQQQITYYTQQLAAAQQQGDPRAIADAAQGLSSATGTLASLQTPATPAEDPNKPLIEAINAAAAAAAEQAQTAAALVQQQIDQSKEATAALQADTALRDKIFSSQSGQIMAGIADMVSGQIGGRIGLGVQTPSFAGGRVRY